MSWSKTAVRSSSTKAETLRAIDDFSQTGCDWYLLMINNTLKVLIQLLVSFLFKYFAEKCEIRNESIIINYQWV